MMVMHRHFVFVVAAVAILRRFSWGKLVLEPVSTILLLVLHLLIDGSYICLFMLTIITLHTSLNNNVLLQLAIETTLMYQLLKLSTNINFVSSLTKRIIQTTTLLLIIFASSTFGSIVDMGLSAASKQVLDPNSTPNPDWYSGLKKPKWNPPGWIFPIMWLIVSKPTQFIAVSKLIATQSKNGVDYPNLPLLAYCTHLALGDAWNKGKCMASLCKQHGDSSLFSPICPVCAPLGQSLLWIAMYWAWSCSNLDILECIVDVCLFVLSSG